MQFERNTLGSDGTSKERYALSPYEKRAGEIIMKLILNHNRRRQAEMFANLKPVLQINSQIVDNPSIARVFNRIISPQFIDYFQEDIRHGFKQFIISAPLENEKREKLVEMLDTFIKDISRGLKRLKELDEVGEVFLVFGAKHLITQINCSLEDIFELLYVFGKDNPFFPSDSSFNDN